MSYTRQHTGIAHFWRFSEHRLEAMPTINTTTDPAHTNSSPGSSTENQTNTNLAVEGMSPMLSMNDDLTNVLFAHIGSTFSTRELVQLTSVSKPWTSLVSSNIKITTKARLEDDTKDWYFPLRFSRHPIDTRTWVLWDLRTWHGLHHASLEIHRLPPLPRFSPLPRFCSTPPTFPFPAGRLGHGIQESAKFCKLNCLLASSGGLLLFADEGIPGSMYSLKNWRLLLVCNPITKTWRVLPNPILKRGTMGRSSWEYWGVQAHLVIDEEANSYTVIITLRSVLFVYTSTTNTWKTHVFPGNFPWKSRCRKGTRMISNYTSVPSATLNGKLYYAELEVDGDVKPRGRDSEIRTKGHLRVFEVDYQAGTWNSPILYALINYFPDNLPNHELDYGFRRKSYTMKLVPCMGVLYAIIPAGFFVEDEEVPVADFGEEVQVADLDLEDMQTHFFLPGAQQEENVPARDDVMMMPDPVDYDNYYENYIAPFLHQVGDVDNEIDHGHIDEEYGLEDEEGMDVDELDSEDSDSDDEIVEPVTERGYYCMPLQFYVVPLHGATLDVGQLLTPLERPRRTDDVLHRLSEDFNPMLSQTGAANGEGFHCAARGSTIWVTWWDFLLQYDVVSEESQCQTLPREILPNMPYVDQPNLSFSPSFHMTP